ncbi:acyltransferase family protein [Hymenobacter wooponensis]|uniref:Acyltransferase n=1 Tax=Hymenobacter wooponensis TaxID=1525360 RepID=A0A4Z0MLV9_9BACT|nr:acyltransferase family protein [Hymenobacter wooponensis]TGD80278.1 acyltransferase [Hymenobacter wooponensis]
MLRPPTTPDIFVGTPNPIINGAMWSISYEFRCYALVALVGVLGSRYQKPLWAALLALTLVLNCFPAQMHAVDFPGLYLLLGNFEVFVRVFSFFSAGACFYLFRQQLFLRGSVALVAFGLLIVGMFYQLTANLVLPTVGGYSLFWLAFAPIPALRSFQRLDDVSYGLYLYGWPTQKLLDWFLPTVSPWLLLPLAFVISCLSGWASWHLVEAHFIRRTSKTNSSWFIKAKSIIEPVIPID